MVLICRFLRPFFVFRQAEAASKDVDESKLSNSHRQMLQTMCGNFDMIPDVPAPSSATPPPPSPPLHTVRAACSTWFPGCNAYPMLSHWRLQPPCAVPIGGIRPKSLTLTISEEHPGATVFVAAAVLDLIQPVLAIENIEYGHAATACGWHGPSTCPSTCGPSHASPALSISSSIIVFIHLLEPTVSILRACTISLSLPLSLSLSLSRCLFISRT